MTNPPDPTEEEARAIRSLKRVARKWPKSLWLYAGSGGLHVMRADPDGGHYHGGPGGRDAVDPDYLIDTIDLPADGGDW